MLKIKHFVCLQQRGGCSNRAQRRASSEDRVRDRDRDSDSFNRTKGEDLTSRGSAAVVPPWKGVLDTHMESVSGPEMASCVRSRDCAAGLCCARYLTGKRCQRIPGEGEACLLQGSTKLKRNLGRCSCGVGLSCSPLGRAESGKNKGQGVCQPHTRQSQRKTRHSGKKKTTAVRSC